MIRRLPLRHTILGIVAGLVIITLGGFFALLSYTAQLRDELERDTQSLFTETEIAEQIVVHVDRQLLEAQRYLRDGDPATLARFRSEGDQVYTQIGKYLLHDLSAQGRMQVEEIKELHEMFEVAAQSAFDRAYLMQAPPDATTLADQVVQLESAVDRFRALRRSARESLRQAHQERLHGIYVALLIMTALLVGVLLLLARVLQHRLLAPITELGLAASRLGRGELGSRVAVRRKDEMGAVSASFNDMAERIQSATEEAAAQHEELMETFDHLQRTQQELIQHEKLSAMGEMLAGLAHELNNPLAGVLGLGECLMQELQDGTFDAAELNDEVVRPLVAEALRARDLVHNLLSFSRMSSTALQPVELIPAVRIATGIRGFAFAQAQLRLEVAVPDDLWVVAEPQQLQHAFVNILNNARDALVSGGGTGVRVSAAALDDEWVEIIFADDGPGFRDPERVFDPFYTTKPVGSGTGLGLTLVHRFVRHFGGSVSVRNARQRGERRGAIVRLQLPRAAPAPVASADAVAPAIHAQADVQPTEVVQPPPPVRQPCVLVVDDEGSLRSVQRRMLAALPVEVVLAEDATTALAVLAEREVTAVITDIRMPGAMGGVQLYEIVRREWPALAERVLFVTGDLHDVALGEFLEAHPERVIRKPFGKDEYLERVRELLGEVLVGVGSGAEIGAGKE